MIRNILSAVLAVAIAVQPIAASAQQMPFYRHNAQAATGTSGGGTVTPPPSTGNNTEPVRGTGDLAIYLPVQIRARFGVPFSLQIVASNAEGAVTWTNVGSSLPQGLSFNPATGFVTGTPTRIESSTSVRFAGVDSTGKAGESPSLVVDVQPVPTVDVQANYTGRTGEATTIVPQANPVYGSQTWNLIGSLPLGLSLNPTNGNISGTPRQQGTFAGLRLRVTDADGASGTSAPFTITINSNIVVTGLPSSIPLRLAKAMTQVRPFASGTPGPYQWSVSAEGTPLPPGLSVNTASGAIDGTPTVAGTTSGVALRIVDATTGYSTITAPFSIVASAAPSISVAANYNVRQGQNSVVYVTPTGNNLLGGGYWTISGRPAPYSLDAFSGVLAGTTGAVATYPGISFSVIDLFDGATATSSPTTLNIWPELTLSSPAVPTTRVDTPFVMQPGILRGLQGTASWRVNGALPDGLSISPDTGVVSGTPTTVGIRYVTITVTDSADGASKTTQQIAINILSPEAPIPFEIASVPAEIPGTTERFLRFVPTVMGAKGTVTWSLDGTLPSWLLLDTSNGMIAGTPPEPVTLTGLRYTATDAFDGSTVTSSTFSIKVSPFSPMTASMPASIAAMVGENFNSAAPTLTNSSGGRLYTLASGILPEGLGIDERTGRIAGVPEVSGEVAGLSLLVTDQVGGSAVTNTFSIVVSPSSTSPAIAMSSRTLTTRELFSASPTVQNANSPATWVLESGTLPTWASIDPASGTISGTPPEQGTVGPFVLKVTDRFLRSARTSPFTFTIVDFPQFSASMASTVPATVGSVFYAVPYVIGARGAVNWTRTSGTLPTGLSVNAATGAIQGVPTTSGVFGGIVLSGTDATNATVSTNAFSIAVSPSPLTMQSYPSEVRATYDAPFQAPAPQVGGTVGTATWSLASGNLPTWATVNAATGRIEGTPNALSTTLGLRLRVTDTNGTNAQTNLFSLIVQRPTFGVSVPSANGFHANNPISITPVVSGIVGTATWTLTSGNLQGLAFNPSTGAITGAFANPTVIPNLVVSVRDSFDGATASSEVFSISVLGEPSISVQSSYPGARSTPFVALPTATNVFGALTWSAVDPSALPAWATLDPSTGRITGTPPEEGVFPGIALRVVDSASGSATSAPFSISVGSGMYVTTVSTTYNPRVGTPFATEAPQIFRNSGAVTWTRASGSLPTWATLDPATGRITGTPNAPSTASVTLMATDATNATALTQTLVFETTGAPSVTYASASLRVGAPLTLVPTVVGARGAQEWKVESGELPAWATLDPTTGVISGTPLQVATVPLSIRLRDGDGSVGISAAFNIASTPGLTVSNKASSYGGRISQPFTMSPVTIGNAIGSLSWSLASNSGIVAGMGVNAANGILTGTPLGATTTIVNVIVRDSADQAVLVVPYSVAIAGELKIGVIGTLQYHEGRPFSTPAPPVTGQRGQLTWSVVSGSVPGWLTLDPATGIFSGTGPAISTVGPLTVTVTDSADQITSAPVQVTVSIFGGLGVANLPTSFTARFGMEFVSARPSAVNVVGTSTWAWGAGSAPPAWLSLDQATGVLTGTPTQLGATAGLSLVVTDSTGTTASSAPFTLNVFSQPDVAVSAYTLKQRVGDPVQVTATATGLSGTPTWSLVLQPGSDPLPAGLRLDEATGVLNGTPTAAGSSFFSIRVVDGNDLAVAESPLVSLTVSPTLSITGMAASYFGRVGSFLALDTPVAQGQVGGITYTLALQSGALLPQGFSMVDNTVGQIRGVPSTGVNTTIAYLTARDSFDNKTASSSFTLGIRPAPSISGVQDVSLRNGVAVGTSTFTPSASNLFYPGGAEWSVSGQLPNGVQVNTATGVLTGTPTGYASSQSFPGLVLSLRDATDGSTVTSNQFKVTVNTGLAVSTTQPNLTVRGGATLVAAAPSIEGLGGTATWSVVSLSGPAQPYTVSPAGVVTLSPGNAAAGTWVYALTATDSADGRSASTTVTVVIVPRTNLSYTANTAVTPGTQVTLAPNVSNNLGNLNYELASGGPLPTGLTLTSSTGVISGTLSTPATVNVTVRGIDTDGFQAVSNAVRISFTNAPDVYLSSIPQGKVGRPFSIVPTTNTASVAWTLTGTLPSGLNFVTATGAITGSPQVTGTFGPFTINARNTVTSVTGSSESFQIVVQQGNVISVQSAAPKWRVGLASTTTLAVANAVGAVTWTVPPSSLPNMVAIAPSTGTISGSPTQFGTFTPTVTATDSEGTVATLSVAVSPSVGPSLSYTPSTQRPGVTSSIPAKPQNLLGAATYAKVSGDFPPGMDLNPATGAIFGTPSVASPTPYVATVRVTDTDGAAATSSVSVVVSENAFLVDAGGTSFSAQVASPFNLQPVAYLQNEAIGQYVSWSIQGPLPNGLNFDPITGRISGTPTPLAIGTKTFSITATYNYQSASTTTLTLVVADRPTPVVSVPSTSYTVARGANLTIDPTITQSIGTVTWSVPGVLPTGLAISETTGRISGTATQNGTFTFAVRAADSTKNTSSPNVTVVVTDGITTSMSPVSTGNRVGKAFLANAIATGNTGSVNWTLVQGPLPTGVAMNASGQITGTPEVAGDWNVKLRAIDATGAFKDLVHTFSIGIGPSVGIVNAQSASVGKAFSLTPTATGIVGSATWSVTGTLPNGVTLTNASTGTISGSPTTAGTSAKLVLSVTDQDGLSASSREFTITVAPNTGTLTLSAPPVYTMKVGQPVSIFPSVSNATGPTQTYSWEAQSGGTWYAANTSYMPPGLTVNPNTGELYGTPTALSPNFASYRLKVVDNRTPTAASAVSNQFTLSIASQDLLSVTVNPSYEITRGDFMRITPVVTGAVGTVSFGHSIYSGNSWFEGNYVPTGMSQIASTGAIEGTVNAATISYSTYRIWAQDSRGVKVYSNPFTVTLKDWDLPTISVPGTYVLKRGQQNVVTPTVAGTRGTPSFQLDVWASNAWLDCGACTQGYLPTGITFNPATGALEGNPRTSSVGYPNYRVRVVDNRSGFNATATSGQMLLTIQDWVLPTISVDSTVAFYRGVNGVMTPTIQGVSGTIASYSLSTRVSGSWVDCGACTQGYLPPGLRFDTTTGLLSGIATGNSVSYPVYMVNATETRDSQSIPFKSNAFTLGITDFVQPKVTYPDRTVYGSGTALDIRPTLTDAEGTRSYTLKIYHSSTLYSCTTTCTTNGYLPAGIQFSPTTGIISGSTTAPVARSFYVEVAETRTYAVGSTSVTYNSPMAQLVLAPAAGPTLTYNGTNLVSARVAGTLSVTPVPSSGAEVTGAYTLTTQQGTGPALGASFWATTLPTGISFSTSTGAFTTPTTITAAAGNWRGYKVCAPTTLGTACTPEVVFKIDDRARLAIDVPTYMDFTAGNNSSYSASTVNSVGTMTYTLQSQTTGAIPASGVSETIQAALPSGLSFVAATGTITGAPSVSGTFRGYTITATDAGGAGYSSVSREIVIRIAPAPAFKISVPPVVETSFYEPLTIVPTVENAFGTVTWSALTTRFGTSVATGPTYRNTTLPSGLGYTSGTGADAGRITGNVQPSASVLAGDYRGYQICATDQSLRVACTGELLIRVKEPAPLVVEAPSIVTVRQGESVTITATVRNNLSSPVTWNALSRLTVGVSQQGDISQSALPNASPSGTLGYANGVISGTVSVTAPVGRYRGYKFSATDIRGVVTLSNEVIIQVLAAEPLRISQPFVIDATRGQTLTHAPTVTGAIGTVTWGTSLQSLTSTILAGTNGDFQQTALPSGLSYVPSTGGLTGSVGVGVTPGRYRGYKVTAQDSRAVVTVSEEFIINVQ